jgi:hypothetical protein
MTARNQLTQSEARRIFDYRDGTLYWRRSGSGQRVDRRAVQTNKRGDEVRIGGRVFMAHYLVWNWHHGPTTNEIRPRNFDIHNISIENLWDSGAALPVDTPESYGVAVKSIMEIDDLEILERLRDTIDRRVNQIIGIDF